MDTLLVSFMTNFIVIFICLIAGLLCKKLRHFPAHTAASLNAFIIYISLPGVVLSQLPQLLVNLDFDTNWWLPASMAWICFSLSFLVFGFLGKRLNWKDSKTGALILTAGLGNTSFVGLPLLDALIGPEALPIGILADQPGSFLVLSTLGILVAAFYSGAKITPTFIVKRVFTFPPFIALLVSFIWFFAFGRNNPNGVDFLLPVFEKLGSTLVPLALFAVGFQLKIDLEILRRRGRPLLAGLLFKLLVLPSLMALLYIKILGGHDLATHVIALESAMATMITAAVVAGEFNLDSELANLMVGLSIPLSLVTVPLWNYFLGF